MPSVDRLPVPRKRNRSRENWGAIKTRRFFRLRVPPAELPVARGPGLRVYASATSVPGTLVVYIEHEVQLVVMDERARETLGRQGGRGGASRAYFASRGPRPGFFELRSAQR